jgi:hypothetical protein
MSRNSRLNGNDGLASEEIAVRASSILVVYTDNKCMCIINATRGCSDILELC